MNPFVFFRFFLLKKKNWEKKTFFVTSGLSFIAKRDGKDGLETEYRSFEGTSIGTGVDFWAFEILAFTSERAHGLFRWLENDEFMVLGSQIFGMSFDKM